jgi:hypothetical protein
MSLRRLALLPALLLAAPFAHGQEPPKEKQPQVIHVPLPQNADDPHQQMRKLISEVEQRLRQIDKLLTDAGAAQRPASNPTARTAELVKRSQDEGRQVIEAIDKILELADHPHPAGGS